MEKVGAFTERVTTEGEWRAGNPSTGETATPMLADYFNMLQRELLAILTAAGVAPDVQDEAQLAESIDKLATSAFQQFGLGVLAGQVGSVDDLDAAKTTGFYSVTPSANGKPFATGVVSALLVMSENGTGDRAVQLVIGGMQEGELWTRGMDSSGQWLSWKKVFNSGNDGPGSGLDADTLDGFEASDFSRLAVGQTWQNVKASRTPGVTYTNSTGKPIYLSVTTVDADGNNAGLYLTIDGSQVSKSVANTSSEQPSQNLTAIIPDGSSYKVDLQAADTLGLWWELR